MSGTTVISVQSLDVRFYKTDFGEYLCITDIAKYRNRDDPFSIINNWLRSKSTIEFAGLWEQLHNPNFKPLEFERFKTEAGSNYFLLSPKKWIEATAAVGLISKSGRYGGTFAHIDIALEFTSWVSPAFKLYLIKEFKRLKEKENGAGDLGWNLQRTIAKINYRIHTDAVKEKLIPPQLTREQASVIYANEADLLNVALFGVKSKDWKIENSEKKGNIRDHATIEQLVILSNLESINALFLAQNLPSAERLLELNRVAITQMKSLLTFDLSKKLEQIKTAKVRDNILNLPPLKNS